MSEREIVSRLKSRILPKVPGTARHDIEIEIKRIEAEVDLRADVLDCNHCPLAASCTNKVPGMGPIDAPIMFIGESPGETEDKQGMPFVGSSGELFNKAIAAIGWKREDLYITNILKCHPEGNRNPTTEEIASCYRHLQKEIQTIKPKVIVAMGSIAASTLIHPDFKITKENGHWFEVDDNTRAIAVYHPSYILRLGDGSQRQNAAKWEMFNALKKIKEYQDSGFESVF
jgi:uracil-DNA glycosylase